jgi:ketosteroid isomerase-like protein
MPLTPTDRLDLLDLYARYSDAEEAGDVDAVLALFVEDGVLESPRGRFQGQAMLRAVYGTLVAILAGKVHVNFSHVVTGEGAAAEGRAKFLVVAASPPALLTTGSYADTFRKEGGAWKFVVRRLRVAGEMPEGLR